MDALTTGQWRQYEAEGYLHLGKVLDGSALAALQERIDAIMLGEADVDYDRMLMQLDFGASDYGDIGEQTKGHKGATLEYRKIEDLEWDPIFLEYMQRPLFRDICERCYGGDAGVACFRAMFMNKPAGKGSYLPWHQDRWSQFDRDPQVTIWTALDPATRANGCVQIIPGSHKDLLNPDHPSGFLEEEHVKNHVDEDKAIHVELEAGEAMLLHNWLLHASDVNRSEQSRRAFSVCYMDAATENVDGSPQDYTVIFGDGALDVDSLKAARGG